MGEAVAFGGGGGVSQRMHTLPQESPQQDPEMQMHTGPGWGMVLGGRLSAGQQEGGGQVSRASRALPNSDGL